MVIVLKLGLFPFQMAASWLINGCAPNHLRPSWDDPPSRFWKSADLAWFFHWPFQRWIRWSDWWGQVQEAFAGKEIHQTFFKTPLKWRNPHLYKLYGYGFWRANFTTKIAGYKVQYLHIRYLKLLVNNDPILKMHLTFRLVDILLASISYVLVLPWRCKQCVTNEYY